MNALHAHSRLRTRCVGLAALLLLVVGQALAQPCLCVDCPEPIPATSTLSVCYDVQGLANNTLGSNGQAVCGVNLEFAHDYIENLGIWLRSPGGQRVQLVGPGITTISSIPTAGARWNIDFVECGEPVNPVPGTGPPFSGNSTVWSVLGNYSGSYYPFTGCLSDLSTGQANGQWCLDIQSSALITNNDALLDFQVEFCDESGPGCCYAEPPLWQVPVLDTVLCAADTSLLLEVTIDDDPPSGYAQRVIVSRNDTVLNYATDLADLQAAQPGTYQLCGLEYFLGDANQLPNPGSPVQALLDSLTNGDLCAALTSDCQRVTILPRPVPTLLADTICAGDSLVFAGGYVNTTGLYQVRYTSAGGCDSLVELDLTVATLDTVDFAESLCAGDTLQFFGREILAAGTYSYLLTNQAGCDSLVRLEVVGFPSFAEAKDTAFCAGGNVLLGTTVVSTSGPFRENLQTSAGCDSTLTWTVTELDAAASIQAPTTTLTCSTPSVTLTANQPNVPGAATFSRSWTGPSGGLGDAMSILADEPGWYYLEHRLEAAGVICTERDSVEVLADGNIAQISVPDTIRLTCDTDSVELVIQTNQPGGYLFSWTRAGGLLSTDSTYVVRNGGLIEVIGVRTDNGCADTTQVEVLVDRTPPQFTVDVSDTLSCTVDSVELSAASSTPDRLSFQWYSPGRVPIAAGTASLFVDVAGTYRTIASNTATGCVDSLDVEVLVDTTGLQLTLDVFDTLTCSQDAITLYASVSEPAELTWSLDGTLVSTNADSVVVDEAGTYRVAATSRQTGCTITGDIVVAVDTTAPQARIASPDTLRCFPPVSILDASASTGSHRIAFSWSGAPGSILSGSLSAQLRASAGGLFTLEVTDEVNGCTDTATVTLVEERTPPLADAGPDQQLDCTGPTVPLGGPTTSSGPNFDYRWSALDGGLVGFPDGPTAQASGGGRFVLQVRNTLTGCLANDTVVVTLAQGVPLIQLEDTTMIACGSSGATLDASGSSTDSDIIYRWTTTDGVIVGANDQVSLTVASSGTYRLTLTDTVSACTSFANAYVIEACPASVQVASPDTITCASGPEIQLQAVGTSGPGNLVQWTTTTGVIVADTNSFTPLVRGAGRYYVEVSQSFSNSIAIDSVDVVLDTIAPRTSILGPTLLNCAQISSCVELEANAGTGDPVTFEWRTLGGQFCGLDTSSAIARVNAPGLYEVTVTLLSNGCIDAEVISVDAEPGLPIPDGGPNVVLACGADSARLTAVTPVPATGRSWVWTDRAGSPLADSNALALVVAQPGVYAFTVVDSLTACVASDTVYVIEQRCAPDAQPVSSGNLTCTVDTVTLSTPIQHGMQAVWYPEVDPTRFLPGFAVQVTEPGVYTVVVTNDADGQVDSAQVEVRDWRIQPQARIVSPALLTCTDSLVSLDARTSVDSLGQDLAFTWSDPDGNLLAAQALTEASMAGEHRLIVQSLTTGCLDTAFVIVAADTSPPTASAVASAELDCNNTSVVLDAASSSGQGSLSYRWRALSDTTTLGRAQQLVVADTGRYQLTVQDAANGCTAFDTLLVTSFRESDIMAIPPDLLPCVGGQVALVIDALPTGGQVRWADPASCLSSTTGARVLADCEGAFRYEVSNADGSCTYGGSIEVARAQANFSAALTGATLLTCENSTLTVFAESDSLGISFEWSGVATGFGDSLLITEPGQLTLVAMDAAGCTDTVSSTITQDTLAPRGQVIGGDTINCRVTQRQLQFVGDPQRRYAYRWIGPVTTPADTSLSLRVSDGGTYQVEVEDRANGCISVFEQSMVLDTSSALVSLTSPAGDQLSCSVSSVELVASVQPTSAAVRWRGPAGQAFTPGAFRQNVSIAGVYTVVAEHPRTGCGGQTAAVVTDVSAPLTGYSLSSSGQLGCTDTAVALIANVPDDLSFTWVDAAGDAVNANLIDSAGTYYVSLEQATTGCRATDSLSVTAYQPSFTLAGAPADTLTCETGEVLLQLVASVPSNVTLSWTGPQGSVSTTGSMGQLVVTSGGTWIVSSVEANSGCVQSAEIEVPVSAEAITEVLIDVVPATCPGERDGQIEIVAVLGGDGEFRYQLDDGQSQQVGQFGLLESGVYDLLVLDGNGCSYTLDVVVDGAEVKEVVVPELVVARLGEQTCVAYTSLGAEPDSVRWSAPDLVGCSTCEEVCLEAQQEQTILLAAYFDGCLVTRAIELRVQDGEPAVWPTAFSPNGDGKNDTWLPFALDGQLSSVRVYDRWGSVVFSTSAAGGVLMKSWDGMQNGRRLVPAVYAVEVAGITVGGRPYVLYGDLTLMR